MTIIPVAILNPGFTDEFSTLYANKLRNSLNSINNYSHRSIFVYIRLEFYISLIPLDCFISYFDAYVINLKF